MHIDRALILCTALSIDTDDCGCCNEETLWLEISLLTRAGAGIVLIFLQRNSGIYNIIIGHIDH